MAFSNNDVSIETRFQLNNSPENFKITDNADYVGTFGIALADVEGALVIKSPLGNVIHSTVLPASDIDLDVQNYIDTIGLPTDVNGDVLKGVYEIEYTVRIVGAVDPGDYTKTFLYNYCYEPIIPKVDLTVDLICAVLTSTDNTSYPQEVTSTNLTHEIHPPAGLDPNDFPVKSSSTTVLTYGPDISTKTWTGKITNIIELTFPASGTYSEHFIDVTITGNSERDLKDDINICNLQCNMRALVSRYEKALENNPIDAVRLYNDQVGPALINAFMYTSNIQCGNFDKATEYYNSVLKFTGSNPECACDDSEVPMLIKASCTAGGGSGLTYVVDACNTNSAITVTSNQVADEITFTVCFDDAMWNKLVALTETVITSNDSSVTITPTLNGYIMTYDLSVSISPSASPVHSFTGIMEIDLSSANPPTLGWDANYSDVVGNKLQEPDINNSNPTNPDWGNRQNCFYLDNYIDQSGGEFPVPIMQIVQVFNTKDVANNPCREQRTLFVEILQIDEAQNRIYFQILDKTYIFAPTTGATLSESYGKIRIAVKLNA